MKTLAGQMAAYAAYHRDARNKATHYVGELQERIRLNSGARTAPKAPSP